MIVLKAPHPILKIKTALVEKIDDELVGNLKQMLKIMYPSNCAGLAANQVDISKRMFVMDYSEGRNDPHFIINPKIISKSDEKVIDREGCLSFPGIIVKVERSKAVKIKYIDENENEVEKTFEDHWARCVQHEIDHLDGITFIDHLSKAKQKMLLQRVK